MGSIDQNADWDHWERHPAGDEILTLLSGEIDVVLETDAGEQRARSSPARPSLCPKGRLAPRHRQGAGPADVHHGRAPACLTG